jgi:AcrR family transcriptional regulator
VEAAIPPNRRLSRGERRERILAAAAQTFATRGYDGAGLDEIAASAGITKAVIYDHFGSKEELHRTLLELRLGDLLGVVAEAISRATTPEDRTRAGIEALLEFMERDRFAWRALFRDPGGGAAIGDFHNHLQRRVTEVVVGWITAELPSGRPADARLMAEVLAELFKGALSGVANWWYEHPEIPRQALVDITMSFAWNGLANTDVEDWPTSSSPGP